MRAREAGRVVLKVRRVVDADAAVDGEDAGLRRVGMRRANIVRCVCVVMGWEGGVGETGGWRCELGEGECLRLELRASLVVG